jgi:hypothetical protein
VVKVRLQGRGVASGKLMPSHSRLWLLTSIIGLIKLYTTQLPVLTSAALIERSETAARPSPRGKSSSSSTDKALRDARWTARKLWCDVVFACGC